jgi:hypothetical protein
MLLDDFKCCRSPGTLLNPSFDEPHDPEYKTNAIRSASEKISYLFSGVELLDQSRRNCFPVSCLGEETLQEKIMGISFLPWDQNSCRVMES